MCEQNASYLAKHSELGSNSLNKIFVKLLKKHLSSHYSMQIFKIIRECFPWTQICSAKKIRMKKKYIEVIAPLFNFSLRHWFRGVGYSSDYSKKHAFATCDHSVIDRLVHGTYFSIPSHPMRFPSKYNSINYIKFMKIYTI